MYKTQHQRFEYEIRLIFEPKIAYYAATRATDKELERILYYGKLEEETILKKKIVLRLSKPFINLLLRLLIMNL